MNKNTQTEIAGINYIASKLNEFKWFFRQKDKEIGIDAEIEIEEYNLIFQAQIKSGLGNFKISKDKKHLIYYTSERHYKYWTSLNIPLLFLGYLPEKEECYWQIISPNNFQKTNKTHKLFIPFSNTLILQNKDILLTNLFPIKFPKVYYYPSPNNEGEGTLKTEPIDLIYPRKFNFDEEEKKFLISDPSMNSLFEFLKTKAIQWNGYNRLKERAIQEPESFEIRLALILQELRLEEYNLALNSLNKLIKDLSKTQNNFQINYVKMWTFFLNQLANNNIETCLGRFEIAQPVVSFTIHLNGANLHLCDIESVKLTINNQKLNLIKESYDLFYTNVNINLKELKSINISDFDINIKLKRDQQGNSPALKKELIYELSLSILSEGKILLNHQTSLLT